MLYDMLYDNVCSVDLTDAIAASRKEFESDCYLNDIRVMPGGPNEYEISTGKYTLCGVIDSEKKFIFTIKLIEQERGILIPAQRRDKKWLELHLDEYKDELGEWDQDKCLTPDSLSISRYMTARYRTYLATSAESGSRNQYFGANDIKARDKAIADNPALDGESEDDYFSRVADMQECQWLVPRYVKSPGYWDTHTKKVLLSDAQAAQGIWSYDCGDHEELVVFVFTGLW